MGWWEDRVVPRLTEAALRGHDVGDRRAEVCRVLTGRVLQPGFGSGLDLRFLPDAVTGVGAVEPSDRGWELSERRRARSSIPVERIGLDGQDLAAADSSCDSALITFTLCTIPEPMRALSELVRVVRPGGPVAILEHGLSTDPGVARWQHRLDRLEQRVAGGCHLTRDPAHLLAAAGLTEIEARHGYLPGPSIGRPWTWLTLATAQTPAD